MRFASFFVVRVRAIRPPAGRWSSIAERHHGMNGSERQQGTGERQVDDEPSMQPEMESILHVQLPPFLADRFQVGKRLVQGLRNKGTNLIEDRAAPQRVSKIGLAAGPAVKVGTRHMQEKILERLGAFDRWRLRVARGRSVRLVLS